ncbi:MAG TPA: prepilin-type N-terminal cleavage/methylation domain-containing protein [Fimbriimonadaceae bacterium]|nr:prepilin-type N-terminal cleavage/methylation domain-containing protein [Fimbriimonadaceae bacterium]
MKGARRGFTLVEALVAVALTAIGVVAVLQGMAALTKAEAMMIEKERMQKLALDKYNEIAGTSDRLTTTGDFSDRNENRYSWSATVEPTGVESLDQLTVTVSLTGTNREREETVSGLIYEAPEPQQQEAGGQL